MSDNESDLDNNISLKKDDLVTEDEEFNSNK